MNAVMTRILTLLAMVIGFAMIPTAVFADPIITPIILAAGSALATAGTAAGAAGAAVGGLSTLSTLGTVAGIGGTVLSAYSALKGGEQAKTASEYEAAQLRQRGNEEFAVGQRKSFAARQQKETALSALNARAAASSGDTTDPGVLELGGGIENRGEAQALMEFYRGQTSSNRSMDAAGASIYKGKVAEEASYLKAGSSILDGFTSLAKKYGGDKLSVAT